MIVVTARTLIEDVAPTEPEGTKLGADSIRSVSPPSLLYV